MHLAIPEHLHIPLQRNFQVLQKQFFHHQAQTLASGNQQRQETMSLHVPLKTQKIRHKKKQLL